MSDVLEHRRFVRVAVVVELSLVLDRLYPVDIRKSFLIVLIEAELLVLP